MIYFDTSYIVRLYTEEAGWESVRALAEAHHLACSLHGRAETVSAFCRKCREGALARQEFLALLDQFDADCEAHGFRWLPLSPMVIGRAIEGFRALPARLSLRAADALHLACAALNGFESIYSNDRQLLECARHFGLNGLNVMGAT